MYKTVALWAAAFSVVALVACGKTETPTPTPAVLPPTTTPTPTPTPTPAVLPPTTIATGVGEMKVPGDNPQTPAKIALGQQLFHDTRLSKDGSRACVSCHLNADGNGGHDAIAIGAGDKKLTRHSPVIWNVGFLSKHYWDGRSDSLEAQGTAAWAGGNMGVGKENLAAKAAEIAAIPGYASQFTAVFGADGVTPVTVIKAIAAYERSLVCDNTAWDKAQKGDAAALSADQKRGMELFNGAAGCTACHTAPFFSMAYMAPDGVYWNAGIGTAGKKPEEIDIGRMTVTKAETDWASFKIPSLRNVAKSAPYFHDGSVATLTEAVKLMASGGIANKNLSPLFTDKKLTDAQIKDIVSFLSALDCNVSLEAPKLP